MRNSRTEKRKEIGSEFWNVPVSNHLTHFFSPSTQWYLSGRSALKAIIADLKGCKTVAMPFWCCESMIRPFIDAGYDVNFYSTLIENETDQKLKVDCDILFVMSYFGYTSKLDISDDYKGIVIRDITHSCFSTEYHDADYYFGSLRKWCGIWTGGFAWTSDAHSLREGDNKNHRYIELRKQAMEMKQAYINGKSIDKQDYLRLFAEAEEILESVGISSIAKRDFDLVKRLDVEIIRDRRRLNAEIIREAFHKLLIFPSMEPNDCPMFVPIRVPDGRRDELRKYLIKNAIYCPIHWPISKYHKLRSNEILFYEEEISLVCDQRYTPEDMYRMVEIIKRFMEEM